MKMIILLENACKMGHREIEFWPKIINNLWERLPMKFVLIIAKISNSPVFSIKHFAFVEIRSNKLNQSQQGFQIEEVKI